MNYEYIPRPNVEHHYHIQDLIEAQEKRTADRNSHRDRAKEQEEREQLIKDAKHKETKAFYCTRCKEDFIAESFKEIEIDWSCPTQNIAFYRSKCFKGHWCMRLITDTYKDSYWFRSRAVAMDKGNYSQDVIQPHETGFNLIYGKKI